MNPKILVFTPVNPMRPSYERLNQLHDRNVSQNNPRLYKYVKKTCCLPSKQQSIPQLRGINVCREFNEVYEKYRDYELICKWDDDLILPPNILKFCLSMLDDDIKAVGVGLFQENYGAPQILMVDPVKDGWYGAFSRFYMYYTSCWGKIPIDEAHGDPDNAFQIGIKEKKLILDVPSIHLDHRAFSDEQYKVLVDMASFYLR